MVDNSSQKPELQEQLGEHPRVSAWKKGVLVVTAVLCVAMLTLFYHYGRTMEGVFVSDVQTVGEVQKMLFFKEHTIVGSRLFSIICYDRTGKVVWETKTKGKIVDIEHRGDTLYAASTDRNLYVINMADGSTLQKFPLGMPPVEIQLLGEEYLFVSTSQATVKNRLYVLDTRGDTVKKADSGYKITSMATNGNLVYAACNDGFIRALDKQLNMVYEKLMDYVAADITFNSESRILACAGEQGTVYLLNEKLETVKQAEMTKNADSKVLSLAVCPEGEVYAMGTSYGELVIFDDQLKPLYQLGDKQLRPMWDTAFSQDGSLLGISRSNGGYEVLNAEVITGLQLKATLRSGFLIAAGICLVLFLVLLLLTLQKTANPFKRLVFEVYKARIAYFLILPCFALLLLFNYYPVVKGMVLAFSDWNASTTKIRWIGLENFRMMFAEGYFFIGAKNVLILLLATYAKIITVPLIVAELIFNLSCDRAKYRYRVLFLLPMIVPGMVGALLWKSGIFDPNFGVLNKLLSALGVAENINWLADERYALMAIIITGFPFVSIFHLLVYYGGLISIPQDLFEAAKVDGCSRFKSMFLIDIPMIAPQIKLLMILAFIGVVQDFGAQYFLTGGGPGVSTYVPGLELFYNATRFGRYGYASAMGLFMFLFILGATVMQIKLKSKEQE